MFVCLFVLINAALRRTNHSSSLAYVPFNSPCVCERGCGCVCDRRAKGRGKRARGPFTGHLVCRSGPSGVCAARRPHTQRNVSQRSHIHQGPTVLALGPVQLLTSEATSRDTRPGARGPEGGVGGMVAALAVLEVLVVAAEARRGGEGVGGAGSTGRVRLCHISEQLPTRGLTSSAQPAHKHWVASRVWSPRLELCVCVCVGVWVCLSRLTATKQRPSC